MRPITGTHRRKDGSRRRTYQCANVHASTELCSALSIDAQLVDAAVVNRLDGYLGDFEAWCAEIEAGREGKVRRLRREVEAALAQHAREERAARAIEADYERRVVAGDEGGADEAMRILARRRNEVMRAEIRISASTGAREDAGSARG
jgi:hypothetical protein